MKKSTEKARNGKPRRAAPEPVAGEPMDMEALRGKISNLVCTDAVKMVKKIIAQGNGGHYQAMKYLFEMIGLFPPTAATQEEHKEDSLAGLLLRRLEIPEELGLADEEPGAKRKVRQRETP